MSKILIAALLAASATAPPRTLLDLAGATRPSFDRDRAALVIIDAQREYRSGALPLADFDPALARIASLRDWAHAHGVPVIHVRHVAGSGAAAFAEGSAGAEIVPELTPVPGETVVTKRLPNSFAGTDLAAVLARDGRNQLILTGFMTHMCVEATARAALDRTYTSFVVADATATRDLPTPDGAVLPAGEVKRHALAAIADRFGWIVSSRWIGAKEIGAKEIGAKEIGAKEIGAKKIGAKEIGAK